MAEERNFQRLGLPVNLEYTVPGKGWLRGESVSKDISLGGIRFQVSERIDPGTRVALRIHFPHRARPTTATGELVWVKESQPPAAGFNIGVRFIQADPFDIEALLEELSA